MPKEETTLEFVEFHLRDESFNTKQDKTGNNAEGKNEYAVSPPTMDKQRSSLRSSGVPVLSTDNGMNNGLNSIRFSYSEIEIATNNFSSDNLLGEGGCGVAYKGQLKDGQLITAKVLKEASTQGSVEFHSEVYALSFARHKNIVMLLGYCCKESINILVYEYIWNNSLEWHLFDSMDRVLEWRRRRAIAIEIAQGLCYLHEGCHGFPIIHLKLQDCGLAKWKKDEVDMQTQILGTPGYLCIRNCPDTIDIRMPDSGFTKRRPPTIHYTLGITTDSVAHSLALDKLVDPRLGDSYRMYELYHMARTAYLCVQTDPTMRPSMGGVLHLLDEKHDHFLQLKDQLSLVIARNKMNNIYRGNWSR